MLSTQLIGNTKPPYTDGPTARHWHDRMPGYIEVYQGGMTFSTFNNGGAVAPIASRLDRIYVKAEADETSASVFEACTIGNIWALDNASDHVAVRASVERTKSTRRLPRPIPSWVAKSVCVQSAPTSDIQSTGKSLLTSRELLTMHARHFFRSAILTIKQKTASKHSSVGAFFHVLPMAKQK